MKTAITIRFSASLDSFGLVCLKAAESAVAALGGAAIAAHRPVLRFATFSVSRFHGPRWSIVSDERLKRFSSGFS